MDATITLPISELPEPAVRTLETLLGRQLAAKEQVYLAVVPPTRVPTAGQRQRAAQGLRAFFAQADARAETSGITDAEIDQVVDDAMAHVRRRAN